MEVVRACFESPLVEWDKKSFGAMGQDNIRHHVLAQDRRTALIIGLETDVCVLQTAVGLRESGFRSVAVQDAVGAPKPDHLYGLERMAALGIEKAHVKGVFYEWSRTLERLSDIQGKGIIKNPMRSTL
ncbi:MAG: isochorismatase family protein [Hyphomonadaceae bacterium JAD_PAG50586_4]|nr:MAG: isochorismatase family protein [Hyphomonadaceae bacterium JAD_PAG50586_4]